MSNVPAKQDDTTRVVSGTQTICVVVVTTIITAFLAYAFGITAYFLHNLMEIFIYAALFGGAMVLATGVFMFFFGKNVVMPAQ